MDSLFSFYCDIFAIPLQKIIDRIQQLRYGLSGVEEFYISNSMIEAFLKLVSLLVNASHEASKFTREIEGDNERNNQAGDDSKSEPSTTSGEIQYQLVTAQLEDKTAHQEQGTQTEESSLRIDETDTQFHHIVEITTTRTRSSHGDLRNQDSDLSRELSTQIIQIFDDFDHAESECCAMFRWEDEAGDFTYDGVYRGNIIALTMLSVWQGHCTCEKMPVLHIENIYATYMTYLVRSTPPPKTKPIAHQGFIATQSTEHT